MSIYASYRDTEPGPKKKNQDVWAPYDPNTLLRFKGEK